MRKTLTALAIAAGTLGATGAFAVTFDGRINPNTGGLPVSAAIWDIGGGEFLGLAGLRNAEVGDIFNLAAINALPTSGSFSGVFVADASIFNESVNVGDEITGDLTLSMAGTLFDSVYVSYFDTVVTPNPSGNGTTTFAAGATLDGNPLSPVPLPAAGWMLIAGVGGLVAMKRRKKAA